MQKPVFIYSIKWGIFLDDFHGFPFHIVGERVGSKEGMQKRGPRRMGSRTTVHTTRARTVCQWGCSFLVSE